MDFNLEVRGDEFVFDEKANTILVLREESWNDKNNFKLSMRKCYVDKEGNEKPAKGFSFLTEKGPHLLAEELVRRGYGDTNELAKMLKSRDDLTEELEVKDDEEYYDPKDIFAKEVL